MAKRGGVWFGWSGAVSDDAAQKPIRIERHGGVEFATIDLTPEEHARYYGSYANGVLWPLLHTMPELMSFDRRDAHAYQDVNARFADRLAPIIRPHDLIWIHDYHLMCLPALLRARQVRNPIGFFLHIPFPSPDVLASVPEAAGLIRDLMHADLLGFQTDRDRDNFAAAAETLAGASSSGDGRLRAAGHRIRLGIFPAEIEAQSFAAMAATASSSPSSERLRRSLDGQALILGVDRLDPTKGLIPRLAGFRRLLETRQDWRRRATFLQIAAVSRQDVVAYRELRLALDRESGAINSDFGEADWTPFRFVARAEARDVVAGYMRQARIGLVTPVRDGMNLVAKEFVAAQDARDPGVLVLSRFAGAARQLQAALLVNPHDPDDIADALDRALRMPREERQERWTSLWQAMAGASPLAWGRTFLAALLRASLAGDTAAPLRAIRLAPDSGAITAPPPNAITPVMPGPRSLN
jgi:trehalose 6-phosphate synthase